MTQAVEPKAILEPGNWSEFLQEFSTRNYNRRARFDIFRSNGEVIEEEQESHLEGISLKEDAGGRTIDIIRIDRSEKNTGKIRDTITNVIGVAVQYDTDGSEDILEITDKENTLISLRLESRVDGVS
jgi:hypothetical protein